MLVCVHSVMCVVAYVHVGLLYGYLAGHVRSHSSSEGAFRALKRGYVHWASGRVQKIEVNIGHPLFCHVRSKIKPSMKDGTYNVYLLLATSKGCAVEKATCECAAGYVNSQTHVHVHYWLILSFSLSASCTHVSALLHGLVKISPTSGDLHR